MASKYDKKPSCHTRIKDLTMVDLKRLYSNSDCDVSSTKPNIDSLVSSITDVWVGYLFIIIGMGLFFISIYLIIRR